MGKTDTQQENGPTTGMMMARALVSATVFGAAGAWLGSWLGKRGSAPENAMAKPIMKWGMGGFWALVAAYSSLKASEQERPAQARRSDGQYQPARTEALSQDERGPETAVDAASVVAEGKTAQCDRGMCL